MNVFLKVKIKSLAAEARIIKREEQKRRKAWRSVTRAETKKETGRQARGLREHRIGQVRPESRCALVAYGFLRGRPYKVVENSAKSEPDWDRVQRLIEKFGTDDVRELRQKFAEWCPC